MRLFIGFEMIKGVFVLLIKMEFTLLIIVNVCDFCILCFKEYFMLFFR